MPKPFYYLYYTPSGLFKFSKPSNLKNSPKGELHYFVKRMKLKFMIPT